MLIFIVFLLLLSFFFFFQEKCLNICKNRTIVFALQQRERVTVAIISST